MKKLWAWLRENTTNPLFVTIAGALFVYALGLATAQWEKLFALVDKFFFGNMIVTPVVFYACLLVAVTWGIRLLWRGLRLGAAHFGKADPVRDSFTSVSDKRLTWFWTWEGDSPRFSEVRCKEHDLELAFVNLGLFRTHFRCPTAGCEVVLDDPDADWQLVLPHILKRLRDKRAGA